MNTLMILQVLGWLAVGLVMTIFALTAGFDFGAGILLPLVGKTDGERRTVINTVGPTWDGNQVWLITAGGAIFAIWPRVYAASFSGLYFGFLLVLWALFFRPVAFEYRSKIQSVRWRHFWDNALFFGSLVPPLIIGVAVGNLFLGLPFQFDPISLRFFYGHQMHDAFAVLDLLRLLRPFALLCGLVSVLMMMMHGAAYLFLRTSGEITHRCQKIIQWTSTLMCLLFLLGGIWLAWGISGFHLESPAANTAFNNVVTQTVGGWLANYKRWPLMVVAPCLGVIGALGALVFARRWQPRAAFISSVCSIVGILFTFGLSLFPFIMPSTVAPNQSLLVWNASSSVLSLLGILITAVVMLPIIFIYTTFVYRKIWGRDTKLNPQVIAEKTYELY